MRYISHLDLLRLFRRAASRAKIPLEATCGFNPHPKISLTPALKLGQESDGLFCKFAVRDRMETEEFMKRLQRQLPEGLKISEAKLIEASGENPQSPLVTSTPLEKL